jgi:hypothetical protein
MRLRAGGDVSLAIVGVFGVVFLLVTEAMRCLRHRGTLALV